jgi:hypothetical protein
LFSDARVVEGNNASSCSLERVFEVAEVVVVEDVLVDVVEEVVDEVVVVVVGKVEVVETLVI